MANVLRLTSSWQYTLVVGGVVSLLLGWLAPYIMPNVIELLMSFADEIFKELAKQSDQVYTGEMQQELKSRIVAGFAASFYGIAIGSLCLARSLQAKLFNPGGWQEEFYQIRVQPRLLLLGLLLSVIAPTAGLDATVVVFVLVVALIFSGIALVHGLVAKKKMTVHWLISFYFSMVLLFPTVFFVVVILAVIDSIVDFRSRIFGSNQK